MKTQVAFDPQLEQDLLEIVRAGRVAQAILEHGEVETGGEKLAAKFFSGVDGLTLEAVRGDGGGRMTQVYVTHES